MAPIRTRSARSTARESRGIAPALRGGALSLLHVFSLAAAVACSEVKGEGGDSPAGTGTAGAAGTAGASGTSAAGSSGASGAGGSAGTGTITPRAGAGGGGGQGGAAAGQGGSAAGQGGAGAGEGGATAGGMGGASGGAGSSTGTSGEELGQVPIGWASVDGDGVDTTTGGGDGDVVRPADAQALIEYAESAEPLVIELDGTFAVPQLRVASNKTLLGVEGGATIEGGVRIRGSGTDDMVSNVIVQNIRIHGATSDTDGDGMHVYYAHHVWIDHCEVWDSPDGNLDIVHASNWVTVSWSKFHYTEAAPAPDHKFSNLIGHSDGNEEDVGRLKVTWHHNWWGPGIIERMPRVRYGDVHLFNNYYSAAGNNYAIGAGLESRLLIENNYFDGVSNPHIFYDGEPTSQIAAEGNVYMATTGGPEGQQTGQGASFEAPYDYELDAGGSVKAGAMQWAGPR
jgi:pectate lyase